MIYTYTGGYDDTISNFQGGIGDFYDILYLPNGGYPEKWWDKLYIHGGGGTLTLSNFYGSELQYTIDGQNILIASIANAQDWNKRTNYLVYSDDINAYIGNGATELYVNTPANIILDDTSTGKYFGGIKDITAFDLIGGSSLLWGNSQDNVITGGNYGGSNLWGGWEGNDTLTGGLYSADIFLYNHNGGHDVITNATWQDTVWLFNTNYWDAGYSYDDVNNIMHLYAGTGELEVNCSTGDEYFPMSYPTYQFADGSRWNYFGDDKWHCISYDAAEDTDADIAANPLWGNANEFFGTSQADNIFVSRTDGNDLVFDTDGADTVHLYDAALSDIVSTSVSDNAIAIEFNTGEVAMVSAAENTSPTFKFASGQSYVYNRETSSWREA